MVVVRFVGESDVGASNRPKILSAIEPARQDQLFFHEKKEIRHTESIRRRQLSDWIALAAGSPRSWRANVAQARGFM